MSIKNCTDCEKFAGHKFCATCGRYIGEIKFHQTEPAVITNDMGKGFEGDKRETHPSYAQLSFSRINCNKDANDTLYGSAIRHQTIISLKIVPSEKCFSDYHERYFSSQRPYIEVHMSQAQFSEAITSMNMGSGVPVTLKSLRGEIIPNCQELTIQEKTQRDLQNRLDKFVEKIKYYKVIAQDILDKKGTFNKDDKDKLRGIYDNIITEVSSNFPFLNECLQEALDKNTAAAKSDIEAFFLHVVTAIGLETINNDKTMLVNHLNNNNSEIEYKGND